jgi:hypothetical protein
MATSKFKFQQGFEILHRQHQQGLEKNEAERQLTFFQFKWKFSTSNYTNSSP